MTSTTGTSHSTDTAQFLAARAVADAVLYEGYVLYPYRASSQKNQLRWQFGVLASPQHAADNSERSSVRTECIVDPGAEPVLTVAVRFLQVQTRVVESVGADGRFVAVDRLDGDGVTHVPWDEAIEHDLVLGDVALLPLGNAAHEWPLAIEASTDVEELRSADGVLVGRLLRRRWPARGTVAMRAHWSAGRGALIKVTVDVANTTPCEPDDGSRDEMVRHALVAMHVLLAVDDGTFVSLIEPPEFAIEAVADCHNDGLWPVLVGDGVRDVVLASPIILYDHPEIAPESQGDLYDATEIDEILALRVLTLTDDEKAEARGTDPRAAAIIDRCDDMPPELWGRLHGAIRSLRPPDHDFDSEPDAPGPSTTEVPWWEPAVDEAVDPWSDSVRVGDTEVRSGTRVIVRPSHRADAQDLFYDGMRGTVAGVFRDADDDVHVALSLDDDPATEILEMQRTFRFFRTDEIEIVP